MTTLIELRETLARQVAVRGPLSRDQVAVLVGSQDLDRVLDCPMFGRDRGTVSLTDDGRRVLRLLRKDSAGDDGTKTCCRCGVKQAREDFPVSKSRGVLYRRSWCKVCMKAYFTLRQQRRRLCAKS